MKLEVRVPHAGVLHADGVEAVNAEGVEGAFGLLPRHIDYVSVLLPGILASRSPDGAETLLAVDRGVLVKCGDEVRVAVRGAVAGAELEALRSTVRERFRQLDERERQARSALATLESRFIRRFLEQVRHVGA